MNKLRFALYLLFVFCIVQPTLATHNRAGEITYKQVTGFTYEITVTTYTYRHPDIAADRDRLVVFWGDNTLDTVQRTLKEAYPDNYWHNEYRKHHTFPGPGVYEIFMEDPNRNDSVLNIPGSVNIVFSIKTTLQISPLLGHNSTPVLLNPPIDKAAINKIFIHNPSAYDPDGDSLSYKLTTCLGENGVPIATYTYPEASNSIRVDAITGDLIWDTPTRLGKYNVAIEVEEWRNGIKIGRIIRDMQIDVVNTANMPPTINPLMDVCVEAGTLINFDVTANDSDNQRVTLSATGGPFTLPVSPASFDSTVAFGTVTAPFRWQTNCAHVRRRPYQVVFKAKDNAFDVDLVAFTHVNITIIAPAPRNVQATPTTNSINLTWKADTCLETRSYNIYRRVDSSGFVPMACQNGVPASTGYKLIANVEGRNNTTFLDNEKGKGLPQGYQYCYLITAVFPDQAESFASQEVCTELIRGIPTLTKVSVAKTDAQNGMIDLAWVKPSDFDSTLAPGPYRYLIHRSPDLWGNDLKLIDSLDGINNTTYTDTQLNTLGTPYSYKVEFWNVQTGNRFLIGSPQVVSSPFLRLLASDNALTLVIDKNVPWRDTAFIVYKKNVQTQLFDSLTTVFTPTFTDTQLNNGTEYCYQITNVGKYNLSYLPKPLINHSQQNCNEPIDTVAPCQPPLQLTSNCDSAANLLVWRNPNYICSNDAIGYKVYYSPKRDVAMQVIATINNADDTTLTHYPDLSLAGCYAVAAIDSFQNESDIIETSCIDLCTYYELPNVFTPDGDNVNDLLQPIKNKFVTRIDMKVYNRWGGLVFETENSEINWDGKELNTNKLCADGVYYYVCNVYEERLSGLQERYLVGFIHIITNNEGIRP